MADQGSKMKLWKAFVVCSALASGQAAFAQDTDISADSIGLDERAYISEVIGDWALQCLRTEDGGEEPCQMYQKLTDGNGTPVMEITVFKLQGRGIITAGASIVVPLETLLTSGLRMQIDSAPERRFDFAFCTEFGCYARLGLTAEDVAALKKGAVAALRIVPAAAPDQEVALDLSLRGFTASYAKVSTAR